MHLAVKHKTIIRSDEVFFGWPANNGAWQWGDELLFGVMAGKRDGNVAGMHKVSGELVSLMVRSRDGGENWNWSPSWLEQYSGEDAEPLVFTGRGEKCPWPDDLDSRIIRICGWYDHGGESCQYEGAFYSSADRGMSWDGPHALLGTEPVFFADNDEDCRCTSRTCVIGELIFLTHGPPFADRTFIVRMGKGELEYIGHFPKVAGRQAMPAVAAIDNQLFVACRRRIDRDCWIDLYGSDYRGQLWNVINPRVADTGGYNGNPPALVSNNGKLYLAYGNRTLGNMNIAVSSDGGKNWIHNILRDGGGRDFGYPRLFKRSDGSLICVYYWYGGIEMTEIRETGSCT